MKNDLNMKWKQGTMLARQDEQIMIHSHKGTLISNKKGQNPDTSNMDESQKNKSKQAKQNKTNDIKGKKARHKRVNTVWVYLYEVQQQAKLLYGSRTVVTLGTGVTNANRDKETPRGGGNIPGLGLGGDHTRIYTCIKSSNKV